MFPQCLRVFIKRNDLWNSFVRSRFDDCIFVFYLRFPFVSPESQHFSICFFFLSHSFLSFSFGFMFFSLQPFFVSLSTRHASSPPKPHNPCVTHPSPLSASSTSLLVHSSPVRNLVAALRNVLTAGHPHRGYWNCVTATIGRKPGCKTCTRTSREVRPNVGNLSSTLYSKRFTLLNSPSPPPSSSIMSTVMSATSTASAAAVRTVSDIYLVDGQG